MSPEQLEAKTLSPASDIYSFGVIAYEIVTGRRPFKPDSVFQLLEMQREGVHVMPKGLRPTLPEGAQEVILKALEFDPKKRYQSAAEFGEALAHALSTTGRSLNDSPPRGSTPSLRVNEAAPDRENGRDQVMELAHVLFMDIVGYSTLSQDDQIKVTKQLKDVVREANEFQRASTSNNLVSIPTGDGMALVFFGDPEAPVRCALEISVALREFPEIKLRMGINSGPVNKVVDVNEKVNVAGAGINMAQRIMDCGDTGHILLSKRVADDLTQWNRWRGKLRDLGEVQVKHGVLIHIFNLYTGEIGNPAVPEKCGKKRHRYSLTLAIAAILISVILLGILATLLLRPKPITTVNANAVTPTPPITPSEERQLSYWIDVQKYRGGVPYERPFRLGSEINFERDYRIRLNFISTQPGFLYIFNEGPVKVNGLPSYNMLFPTPTSNSGRAELSPNQLVKLPERNWLRFDDEEGTEKFWLIFAKQSIPELEAVKGVVNERDLGVVTDPAQIKAVQNFINNHSTNVPQIKKDDENKLTKVIVSGEFLVSLLKLEHH
jgi:class 3 adenylate cyclase